MMRVVLPPLMYHLAGYALVLWLAPEQARDSAKRLDDYLLLAESTVENPIRHEELSAAVLSDRGVRSITELFEKSLARSVATGGHIVTPELGGEATLADGRLTFVEYLDPAHDVIRRLLEIKEDAEGMLELLESSVEGKRVLATTGGLHALLYQLTRASGPLTANQIELREQVLSSAVAIHFKAWNVDSETQRAGIEQNKWEGRYVGFWHIHPPRVSGRDFLPGFEPSTTDLGNAVEMGQFVTIVFQPDGFDFYDLAPLGEAKEPRLSRARIIRHRSEAWRANFERVVTELNRR